ncbi:MAG: nucleotidyltransferase family protein [Oscillospiraceae bacterium]|nr:nucleotidyltransferase family protein [Oscillospiraceae bacterium]
MKEVYLENWKLPQELELMLKLCLRQPVAVPEGLDWDYFDALVSQHRVQPLLIRGIRQHGGELPEGLTKYKTMQGKFTASSMARLQALHAVNAAFSDAGIRMISMKGPLLSVELYGDPSLRTSRDLDLLVAEEDLPRADAILRGMGYEQEKLIVSSTPRRRKFYQRIENEKHDVYNRGDICLELHWKGDYQSEVSFDALWSRREERQLMGRPIAVLGADDRYPALFTHAAEHGFLRLRWLLDLYELQRKPGFDWGHVYRLMAAQGIGEIAILALLVMHRLGLPGLEDVAFGGFRLTRETDGVRVEVEADAENAIALSERVLPMLLKEVKPTEQAWKDYDRLLPNAVYGRTRWQWLLALLGPSEHEYELIDLPDSLFWLYFLIRPFCWLARKLFGGKR